MSRCLFLPTLSAVALAVALLALPDARAERGRTGAIKSGVAAELNRLGTFPPNALRGPYTAAEVRMTSRAAKVQPAGGMIRDVKFNVGQISGKARATRGLFGPGGPMPSHWNVRVDPNSLKVPWVLPHP